jgi:5'-3' exonuclease
MSISQNSSLLSNFGTIACVDASYMMYHTIYSAVNKWKSESPNSDVLDNFDETVDEQHDLTIYADFIDTLDSKIIETLFRINNMVNDYVSSNGSSLIGKILLVFDPPRDAKLKSWRYLIYKEYKGQRGFQRNKMAFNVKKIFFKMMDMLLYDDKYRNRFNLDTVYSDGCEADDIIATYFTDDKNKTYHKFLIASDKDYLQLEGVVQMTLEGKAVEIEQPYPDLVQMTPKAYLLAKIIMGDTSDNITQVFNRVGYKTAVKKYVSNIQYLTESLKNDEIAKEKFERNMNLIDFKRMPSSIRQLSRKALGLC